MGDKADVWQGTLALMVLKTNTAPVKILSAKEGPLDTPTPAVLYVSFNQAHPRGHDGQ